MDDEPHVKVTLDRIYQVVLETRDAVTGTTARLERLEKDVEKLQGDSLSRKGLALGVSIMAVVLTAMALLAGLLGSKLS